MTNILARLGLPVLMAASVSLFSPFSSQAQERIPTAQSQSADTQASRSDRTETSQTSNSQDRDDGEARRNTPSISFGLSLALLGLGFLILYFFSTRRRAYAK